MGVDSIRDNHSNDGKCNNDDSQGENPGETSFLPNTDLYIPQ